MKKTRFFWCVCLAVIVMIPLAVINAGAADVWDGTVTSNWYNENSGVLVIDSAEDLAAFVSAVNSGRSFSKKTVELACDIVWADGDLETWRESAPKNKWTPIGTSSNPFTGTFDGKGHIVSGLYYYGTKSGNSNAGFFGYTTDAVIKDLHIENSYINAYRTIGSIVAYAQKSLTVSGCSSNAYLVSNYMTAADHNIGGIVGRADGIITETQTIGNVSQTVVVSADKVDVSDCIYVGDITSDNGCNVGGIVGRANGSTFTISGCFADGTYTGFNRVSGILGRAYSDVEISDCCSFADLYIWGDANIGGILGGFRVDNTVYIHDCYYDGNFYDAYSSTYGSIRSIPTRLGANEISGGVAYGTFLETSTYYTDSDNDNSYSASGNQTGIPSGVKRLGGLDEFLANNDSFDTNLYGTVFPVAYSGAHDCGDHFGKWLDDPESDGQIRGCTYRNCTAAETREQSFKISGASVRYDEPSGIRFLTEVDKNTFFKEYCNKNIYTYTGSDLTFGTLIIPTDMLSGELTVQTSDAVNIEARVILSQNSEKLCYTAVLYGFPETIEAYKDNLTVRSYAKYTDNGQTKYVYTSAADCSFLDIAEMAYADERTSQDVKEGLNLLIALGVVDDTFYDECPDNVTVLEYATPELFAKYAAALEKQGFTKHTNYEYSDNHFGVYYNDDYVVSFYYTPKSIGKYTEPNQEWYAYGSIVNERTEDMAKIREKFGVHIEDVYNIMRVIVEKREDADLPAVESENVYTRTAGMTNTIAQIFPNDNYNHYGMGYIVQLADGSFIIVDGGEDEVDPRVSSDDTDADNLYRYLMEMKPAHHEKPVIAAWFLTHRHNDHVEVIQGFLPKYADLVEVEQVVYNFSAGEVSIPTETVDINRFADKYLKPYLPDAKIITAHTGYKFYIRNAVVTILYSIDDLCSQDIAKVFVNNESIAFDMVIDGKQRIMFTGEIFIPGSRALVNMYGEDLVSDIIQLSHHGHYGATEEVYQYIWPAWQDYSASDKFVLWPIGNEEQRRDRLYLAENLWIIKRIAEDVGIEWKTEWDAAIANIMASSSYKNDAARFAAIGKYLTAEGRLAYSNRALWDKIHSMCDMIFKSGTVSDTIGKTEAAASPNYSTYKTSTPNYTGDRVALSGAIGSWEIIELYTK